MARRESASLSGGIVLGLVALVVLLSFLRVYYIGGDGSCDLLWNQNEAYVFIHGTRLGYNFSYLGYAAQGLKNYFGVIAAPDERHQFTTIVRLTPAGPQRYDASEIFYRVTPLEKDLYAAHYDDPDLWKWAGTHFEKLSTGDQQELGGTDRLSKKDFSPTNGWSGVYSIESKINDQLTVPLGPALVVVMVKDGQVSISLSHLASPPEKQTFTERIYYGSGLPQRVNKAEYEHVFGN